MARRFVFEEDGSSKFWEIETSGTDVTVRFGRIGTQGQEKTKSHPSADAAEKDAAKLVAEKTKKGYREEGGANASTAAPAPAKKKAPAASAAVPPSGTGEGAASAAVSTGGTSDGTASAAAPTGGTSASGTSDGTASSAPVAGRAASGETIVVDGHPVRFRVPEWVLDLAEKPATEKAPKKKGLPFAKVWEGVPAGAAALVNGKNRYHRWISADPISDAIAARVRERLERGEQGEGFDEELEAATLALVLGGSYVCGISHETWYAMPGRVFWHWADRAGGEAATRTFLRALSYGHQHAEGGMGQPRGFAITFPEERARANLNGPRDYPTLRDAVRAFGPDVLGKVVRENLGAWDAMWLLDDGEGADAAVADLRARGEKIQIGARVASLLGDPKAAAAMIEHMWSDEGIVRLVVRHGLAVAAAVFARTPNDPYFPRRWVPPLACFPSIPAARLLVPMLEKKADRKLVGDALAEMPREAVVVLREALGKRVKYKDAIDSLIAVLAPRAESGASGGGAPDAESAGADEAVETAPDTALPKVLASPPWRAKKRPKDVVLEGLVPLSPPGLPAVVVDLATADRKVVAHDLSTKDRYPDARTAAEVAAKLASGSYLRATSVTAMPIEELDALLADGNATKLSFSYWVRDGYTPGWLGLLHEHGARVVPLLLAFAEVAQAKLAADLQFVATIGVAKLAVGWLAYKASAKAAVAWARRFPTHAAHGLVPIALGKAGSPRDRATQLLLAIDRAGHRELVLASAEAYGAAAKEATQTLLDRDPLEICPAKAPKLPDDLDALPRARLRDGRAISADAQRALLEMLAFTPLDGPYVGVEHVVEACDPASLDALAEALVRTWVAGGMASAHEWMVRQVALIGTDAAARFLDGRARSWAQDGSKARAMLGLDVLGAMGSDLALSLVGRVSRSSQKQYMKDRATAILAEIAAARGLDADELEDRTAPDLGLDEGGSMTLDFGPRAFTVGFDEHLVPFVKTAEGERLDAFPRANKQDDASKAKAASEAWKALKSEAEKVSSDQIARLERMMGDERRVAPEIFRAAFVDHPLVGHLARRIVWGAYDDAGKLVATFRVAEDRSLATIDDRETTLAQGDGAPRIGVVHPLTLDDEQRAEWGSQLASYEILQPFPQVGREVVAVEKEAMRARYAGKKAPSALLYGLRRHGWKVSADETGINAFERRVGSAAFWLSFSPSLVTGKSDSHTISLGLTDDDGGGTVAPPTTIQLAEIARQLDAVLE